MSAVVLLDMWVRSCRMFSCHACRNLVSAVSYA